MIYNGKECQIYGNRDADVYIFCFFHDCTSIVESLKGDYCLIAPVIKDWNSELSPWESEGFGVIAVGYDSAVTDSEKDLCKKMLSHMGECIEGDEQSLNVIGAICGCGPAFVYRFMESLISEAVRNGIAPNDARKMVEQTVFGSASMVIKNQDTSIAALREAVTSKGSNAHATANET